TGPYAAGTGGAARGPRNSAGEHKPSSLRSLLVIAPQCRQALTGLLMTIKTARTFRRADLTPADFHFRAPLRGGLTRGIALWSEPWKHTAPSYSWSSGRIHSWTGFSLNSGSL